jgi:hypothetical protein
VVPGDIGITPVLMERLVNPVEVDSSDLTSTGKNEIEGETSKR